MFSGLEVDMLALGDADSILVTSWAPGRQPVRVLVDGGNADSADTILAFLARRRVFHLDHVVCSHLHNDHAAGLITILNQRWLTVGEAWVHQPRNHIDYSRLAAVRSRATVNRVAADINRGLETIDALTTVLRLRGIPIREPFQGNAIGPLVVVSPTIDYYRSLLQQFTDIDSRAVLEARLHDNGLSVLAELLATSSSNALDDSPETSPENSSSVILYGAHSGSRILLTSDAGVEALSRVVLDYEFGAFANLDWMQLPHHGSRRNVNSFLVRQFRPRVAYVSAEGNIKHPRRAVVNAFKAVGTQVFSTHYPEPTHLWYYVGIVPARPDYGTAVSLWNATQQAA